MCGSLWFPSREEAEGEVTPTRQVNIPATFTDAGEYRQVLSAALRGTYMVYWWTLLIQHACKWSLWLYHYRMILNVQFVPSNTYPPQIWFFHSIEFAFIEWIHQCDYLYCFHSLMSEYLNIQLFEMSKSYHSGLAKVDISGYNSATSKWSISLKIYCHELFSKYSKHRL